MSESWRAPQADIFRMPGPLMPQWVMSMGPSLASLVPGILTVVFSTERPDRSVRRESLILNVKRDGTGGVSEWSRFAASLAPAARRVPPVARRMLEVVRVLPWSVVMM